MGGYSDDEEALDLFNTLQSDIKKRLDQTPKDKFNPKSTVYRTVKQVFRENMEDVLDAYGEEVEDMESRMLAEFDSYKKATTKKKKKKKKTSKKRSRKSRKRSKKETG